jgi:hypothetical protein
VKAVTDAARLVSDKAGRAENCEEAFMLNRITAVGFAVALAAALLAIVLVSPAFGPRASRADLGGPSLSIEDLHTKIDHRKLPVHVIPKP